MSAAGPGTSVLDRFARQVHLAPDRPALADGSHVLSYQELEERSAALAATLEVLGAGPEVVVGIHLPRSADLFAVQLAVMRAGAAFVPLDPSLPDHRLRTTAADARAALVVTRGTGGTAPPGLPGTVPVVDLDTWTPAGRPADRAPRPVRDEQLAYVIHTSGSTGFPKGVTVPHRALANLVAWHLEAFGITAADRASQVAAPTFDAAIWEVWPYLCGGASVHVVPDEIVFEPTRLVDWLVERAVTVAFLPTPLAELVMQVEWPRQVPLRTLLTGGDALRRWPGGRMPFRLVNNYGPSEAAVVATSGPVPPGHDGAAVPGIGTAIPGVLAAVLGRALEAVPTGAVGELYLGGRGLARGYLERPALTAERFLPDPHAPVPGSRVYRTGDLVRRRSDGSLQFLGRADRQVKIDGHRIEPAEIEQILLQHPGVLEAAVVAVDAPGGARRLVAHVTTAGPVGREDLRAHAAGRLPRRLVPSAFLAGAGPLPRTPAGKVDRARLAAMGAGAPRALDARAPGSEIERRLAGLWEELLGVARVGADDDFFALGGTSLLAARLSLALQRTMRLDLPTRAVFESPTLAAFARRVAEARPHTAVIARQPRAWTRAADAERDE